MSETAEKTFHRIDNFSFMSTKKSSNRVSHAISEQHNQTCPNLSVSKHHILILKKKQKTTVDKISHILVILDAKSYKSATIEYSGAVQSHLWVKSSFMMRSPRTVKGDCTVKGDWSGRGLLSSCLTHSKTSLLVVEVVQLELSWCYRILVGNWTKLALNWQCTIQFCQP